VENGTARNGESAHFLEAEGLGAKPDVVNLPGAAFAELELDREQQVSGMEFDISPLPFDPSRWDQTGMARNRVTPSATS